MRYNRALGLLFSNMHDETLPELTGVRAMGSVPFGGRYRLNSGSGWFYRRIPWR